MTLVLYENKSDKIVVNKKIMEVQSYEGFLRDGSSITNPTILIEGLFNIGNNINANYLFLPDYRRYYYITEIEQIRSNLVKISASVDVLMSFKDELQNCKGIVKKNATAYNMYLNDGSFKVYQNKELVQKWFPSGFTSKQFVITTAG